jgi:hypothetical protein
MAEAGRPLPAPVRTEMEGAFGQDLGRVRVHDGATSAQAASDLGARAFTIGDHVGFAGGGFSPETPEGRGLLAHELAHVLQGGASDHAAAEVEVKDAVARLAHGERPVVTRRPGAAHLHRAPIAAPAPPPVPPHVPASAPGGASVPETAAARSETTSGPAVKLPPGLTPVSDVPSGLGTTELIVRMDQFTLPLEKGAGPWVQRAYDEAAAGGRLVFSPIFVGNAVAAYKEGGEDYRSVWLGQYGFSTTTAMATAFTASTDPAVKESLSDPEVKKTVTGLRTGLPAAKCDVDHIVEKQMGGTSIPSNLQLLTSKKNQASGRETYQALVAVVNAIRAPEMRDKKVRNIQIRIARATVPAGTSDPSFVIEEHLRAGRVAGTDAEKAKAQGKPVNVKAGGVGETVSVRDTGDTPIDSMSRRIVPGMRLTTYRRGPRGAGSPADTVLAELDSRAVRTTGAASAIKMQAKPPAAAAGDGPPAAPQPAATEAPADATSGTPAESRVLTLDPKTNSKVAFFYPYLSPGELTSLSLDDQGNLSATGVIRPTIPTFRPLNVTYNREVLALAAPLDKTKLRSPFPAGFRFTGGELNMQLSPEFVPSGTLTFSVGPEARPVLLGDFSVALTGGVLVARGKLAPAGKIPGITAASGNVEWNSETGWSGKVMATTSSIPATTANVELGFRMRGEQFEPYASGDLVTKVRDTELRLAAAWNGLAMSYTGGVTIEKPLPMVSSVRLKGRYGANGLFLEGDAPIKWRTIDSSIHLEYNRREDEQEGRLSGRATFAIRTPKAEGSVLLNYDDRGRITGRGTIAYQVTPHIRPQLGVELTPEKGVKMFGEVRLNDITLARLWPAPLGGNISIIKGVGVKFPVPTPVPAVTAYGEIKGSLGLLYGVGPVTLRGVVFTGELYPLEPDPMVKAKLKGALVVPAYAGLVGTFGAYIGLEVAGGAVGAKGGIEIAPRLTIKGEGGVAVDADYDSGGFSFEAEAYATGQLVASATVDLVAELYAAYGIFSHRWTYNAASVSAQLGPTVRLTIGRIAYSKSGELTWPSLSQVHMDPENIDPIAVVKDMLGRGEARET